MKNQRIRYKAVEQAVAVGGTATILINPDNSQTLISGKQLNDAFCSVGNGRITDDVRQIDKAVACIGDSASSVALIKCLTGSIALARENGGLAIVDGAVIFTDNSYVDKAIHSHASAEADVDLNHILDDETLVVPPQSKPAKFYLHNGKKTYY